MSRCPHQDWDSLNVVTLDRKARIALVWHQDHDHPMGAWINGHYYILADNNPQTINRSEDRRSDDHVRTI